MDEKAVLPASSSSLVQVKLEKPEEEIESKHETLLADAMKAEEATVTENIKHVKSSLEDPASESASNSATTKHLLNLSTDLLHHNNQESNKSSPVVTQSGKHPYAKISPTSASELPPAPIDHKNVHVLVNKLVERVTKLETACAEPDLKAGSPDQFTLQSKQVGNEPTPNNLNDKSLINNAQLTSQANRGSSATEEERIAIEVCNYLIDTICPQDATKESLHQVETSIPDAMQSTQTTPNRGRGRGRGGRGRGRGSSRSRGVPVLSRELRELNGVKSDDEIPAEILSETLAPLKRQSRRIQAIQVKKEAENVEKIKREQTRLEELAMQRAESARQREQRRQEMEEEENEATELKKNKNYKVCNWLIVR